MVIHHAEERLFMFDLAVTQLITGILVALGSTLFAISIGFELTLPSAIRQAVGEIALMNIPSIPEIRQELFTESFSTYTLTLAVVGVSFIVAGILYGSSKMSRIRSEIDSEDEGYQTEQKKVREGLD